VSQEDLPERNTDAHDAYWATICGEGGRCGKPKSERHGVHVQYDAGGQILTTWSAKQCARHTQATWATRPGDE
jgi:hypothetical protein